MFTRTTLRALAVCLVSLSVHLAHAAHDSPKEPITEALFLNFLPPNTAAMKTGPPSLFATETPMVIRYTFMAGVAFYDPQAACDPKALSFFGTKDRIPRRFCPEEENIKIRAYMLHRALIGEFPNEMAVYEEYIRSLGLKPDPTNMDPSTMVGWANIRATRLADFMAKDGWNSMGDLSRSGNHFQFEDYTGYKPANNPYAAPNRLFKPLRWQPFLLDEGNGRFTHQVHVTPHIGVKVRPLVLTNKDVAARRTRSPYFNAQWRRAISRKDRALLNKHIAETIKISASLTTRQKFEADWWDSKLFSITAVDSFYAEGLTRFEIAQQFLAEIMSQYDMLLVTWREKRRHDLVRPRTIIHRVLGNKSIRAYDRRSGTVKRMRARDWRNYVGNMPHSEFPSGSSSLCTAAMEAIDAFQRRKFGSVRPINMTLDAGVYPFVPEGGISANYDSPAHAAEVCAESRLWAGVHFRPAIDVGKRMGKGVGKLVFDHVIDLVEGRVPDNCWRCKQHNE